MSLKRSALAAAGVLFVSVAAAASGAVFDQPSTTNSFNYICGTTPSGLAWTAVATGTAMPIVSSGTVNGRPGPVAYWNTVTGQVQIDPKGWSISLFDLTYTTGTVNITGITPGPLRYASGTTPTSSIVSDATGDSGKRTLPAGTWTLITAAPARVAGIVTLVKIPTLATTYTPGNGASSDTTPYATNTAGEPCVPGWFNQPWAFPRDLITSSSLASMTTSNWRTFGHTGVHTANVLGYGNYQGTMFSRLDGVTGGALSPVIPVAPAPWVRTFNITSGTATQAAAGYASLSGTAPVLKAGPGTLVLDAVNTATGTTTIWAGVLELANPHAASNSHVIPLAGGTLRLADGFDYTVGRLSPNVGGVVDVGSSVVKISAGLTRSELASALSSGRGDGRWNGPHGFTSSAVAADVANGLKRAIGWIDNADGSLTLGYAAPGDCTLDGLVDIQDVAAMLNDGKFDTGSPASWADGDYNYDGTVDILDLKDLLAANLFDAGFYRPASQIVLAPVPEPVVWPCGLVALMCGVAAIHRSGRHGSD
jgi:autotransporter-associated beta strand protein